MFITYQTSFHKRIASLAGLAIFLFASTVNAQDLQKWEGEISRLEKAAPPKPVADRIYTVFAGSSSIVFWQHLSEVFPEQKILKHGFGGSQTFEVDHFARRLITDYRPKQVVIYSGENDIAAGKSPRRFLRDFKSLFRQIRKADKNTFVTFISMKPSPSRKTFLPRFIEANGLANRYLSRKKLTSYVDIYPLMLLPNGQPNPSLFKADSLHMVKAGYDIWNEALRSHLK